MRSLLLCFSILWLFPFFLFAQSEEQPLFTLEEPIVVTASSNPIPLLQSARSISIIDSSEIARLPLQSVNDLLQYVNGLDLQQRGVHGIQADVSMRGASFEQTLILIDGLRLDDPQTGHHNLNLPLTLADIERVEILHGSGSRLYGPDAFAGVINFITRGGKGRKLAMQASGGDFAFRDLLFTSGYSILGSTHTLSLQFLRSNGYRYNTDFENYRGTYRFQFDASANQHFFMQVGADKKDFGANGFYSANFPNQRERTELWRWSGGWSYENKQKNLSLRPMLSYRQHQDDFWLDFERPEWYHNHHKTHVWQWETEARLRSDLGITSFRTDYSLEKIKSNNLGTHQREQIGIGMEHQWLKGRWAVILGSSLYHYQGYGWGLYPGLDLSFQMRPQWTWFASVSSGFRAPTFTELYYQSPANKGNSNLNPEKVREMESGFRFFNHAFYLQTSIFYRDAYNQIDWAWMDGDDYWQAVNLSSLKTIGLEGDFYLSLNMPTLEKVRLGYTYLDQDYNSAGYKSKYILNFLRHQLKLLLYQRLWHKGPQLTYALHYNKGDNLGEQWLLDLHVGYPIGRGRLFMDVSNLLGRKYENALGIPQPGRWFKAGLQWDVW